MNEETSNKAKIRRTISLDLETMAVRIAEHTGTQSGGDYLEIHAEVYPINNLPATMQQTCQLHGLAQKLSDHTAGKTDEKGYSTTDRFSLIGDLFNQLESGDWTKRSEGAGVKLNQTQIANKMNELGLTEEQYELAKKMGLIKG